MNKQRNFGWLLPMRYASLMMSLGLRIGMTDSRSNRITSLFLSFLPLTSISSIQELLRIIKNQKNNKDWIFIDENHAKKGLKIREKKNKRIPMRFVASNRFGEERARGRNKRCLGNGCSDWGNGNAKDDSEWNGE